MKMDINRNNYEEFFLMYVDHELSASERKFVDVFLSENPDLQEELSLLQQAKLMADPAVVFDNKEWLLSQPAGSKLINLTNYEEYFMLYADNELGDGEKRSVEKFVAQNEKLQKEFSYILRSRMIPENDIVFKGKEFLYRSEKDAKRIILPWLRMAAAACILLITGFLVFNFIFKKTDRQMQVAIKNPAATENNGNKKNMGAPVTPANPDSLNSLMAKQKDIQVQQQAQKRSGGSLKKKQEGLAVHGNTNPANDPFLTAKKAIVGVSVNGSTARINTADMGSKLHAGASPAIALNNAQIPEPPGTDSQESDKFAQPVALNYMSPDTENGFSVLTTSTGKSTMRGFFRKVSRVFEKTTRVGDEDDKKAVLIGNFQIALK